ncbi:MAG: type IX secretion system membrane protein PorP/SprF [Flavobacteriales bacterium]
MPFFLFFFQTLSAQNYTPFLQGQAAFLYYNPAFAGSTGFHRAAIGTSFSGSKFNPNFQRYYGSYDQYISKRKLGFGAISTNIPKYLGDVKNKVNYNFFEVMLSPKVRLSKKLMLSFGLSGSVAGRSYRKSAIDPLVNNSISKRLNLNYCGGLVLNSKSFYFGYSLRQYTPIIASQDTSFKCDIQEIPALVSTFQGGMIFKSNKAFNFAPSFIYQRYHHAAMQGQNDLTLIANFKYRTFFWALGFGSTNLQLSVGYYGERYRFGYSKGLMYNVSNSSYIFVGQELFFSYTFEDFSSKLFARKKDDAIKEEK